MLGIFVKMLFGTVVSHITVPGFELGSASDTSFLLSVHPERQQVAGNTSSRRSGLSSGLLALWLDSALAVAGMGEGTSRWDIFPFPLLK